MSIKHSVTKQKSILTAIGFITLLSALVFPGRLYGFVELFSFSNPPNPQAGLVQGSDGNFYGITSGLVTLNDYFGSTVVGNGSVFKLTPAGVLTTLVSFNGTNGSNPVAALIQGTDGNFYGTTSSGGAGGNGTMFQMTAAGVLTTLVSFGGMNGGGPNGLVQGTNGNFYGTTESGGTSNYGTVFQATPAGEMTTLYSFTNGTDGGGPNGLVQGNDGNFYGTTSDDYGSGTVFLMTPAGALTTLYSFGIDGTNGGSPQAGLIQGGGGRGAAQDGLTDEERGEGQDLAQDEGHGAEDGHLGYQHEGPAGNGAEGGPDGAGAVLGAHHEDTEHADGQLTEEEAGQAQAGHRHQPHRRYPNAPSVHVIISGQRDPVRDRCRDRQ